MLVDSEFASLAKVCYIVLYTHVGHHDVIRDQDAVKQLEASGRKVPLVIDVDDPIYTGSSEPVGAMEYEVPQDPVQQLSMQQLSVQHHPCSICRRSSVLGMRGSLSCGLTTNGTPSVSTTPQEQQEGQKGYPISPSIEPFE